MSLLGGVVRRVGIETIVRVFCPLIDGQDARFTKEIVVNFSKRQVKVLLFFSVLFFIFVPTALAAEVDGAENITIGANETIADDLYVGAANFVLDGTIQGDLFVGGTNIVINGTVEGDLFAAGQSIIINGTIGDDARVMGMAVAIGEGASIGGDVVGLGYSLQSAAGSLIGADLLFGGFQASLNGEIGDDVMVGANSLEINGRIGGNVQADVEGAEEASPVNPFQFMPDAPDIPFVPSGLTVGSNAAIEGNLSYSGPVEATIGSGTVGGTSEFELREASPNEVDPAQNPLWKALRRLAALVLVGLLLVWQAPSWLKKLSHLLQEKPLPSLGFGTAVYFGAPIAAFILVGITIAVAVVLAIIGLGSLGGSLFWIVAALVFAFFVAFAIILLYLTKLIVGYLLGHAILNRLSPTLAENPIWSLLLGILLVVIVISLPFVGGLANLLIAILGIGALFLLWRSRSELSEKLAVAATA